jgi:hypothetical protein
MVGVIGMWRELSWGYVAALWPQQAQLNRREKVSNHPFYCPSPPLQFASREWIVDVSMLL